MRISEFLQTVQYQDPVCNNFLDISNWEIIKDINEFNSNTKAFFEGLAKVSFYLTHPKVLAWIIWTGTVKYSFQICLLICIFSVIAHIVGWKKGKDWARGSIMIYIIIMMFNSAL